MVRKHIFFSGDVQGVGFRYRSFYIAQSLGLAGWRTCGTEEWRWKCREAKLPFGKC